MHWFTSPYVHRLIHNSKTGLTEVETLPIQAQYQRRTFSESEIEHPNSFRRQSTFEVRHAERDALQAPNSARPWTRVLQAPQLINRCRCVTVGHGQVYYLDADSFGNKELLAMLSPQDQTQEVKPPS